MITTSEKLEACPTNGAYCTETDPLIKPSRYHSEPVWRQYMAALLGKFSTYIY